MTDSGDMAGLEGEEAFQAGKHHVESSIQLGVWGTGAGIGAAHLRPGILEQS